MTRPRLWTLAGSLLCTEPVLACATCFGDPESQMARGAVAGVYVMIGVITFVLAAVAGTGLFWMQRVRKLIRQGAIESPVEADFHGRT